MQQYRATYRQRWLEHSVVFEAWDLSEACQAARDHLGKHRNLGRLVEVRDVTDPE